MIKRTYEEIVEKSTYVAEYDMNFKGVDYVVGDIHGMFSNLEDKLKKIGFNKDVDRLFSVGDLVDRGEESYKVAEYINAKWFFPVRGNHDEFILRSYYKQEAFDNERWRREINGGTWWFKLSEDFKADIAGLVSTLPYAIELNTPRGLVVISHANLPFFVDWNTIKHLINTDDQTRHYIQWNRDRARDVKMEKIEGIYKAYFGHTVVDEISTNVNSTFIDTGSGYENINIPLYKKDNPRLSIIRIS